MTNKEVCEILNTIKDAYQNFKLDEGVVKTWSMIFSEYEYEPILASLKKYLKTSESGKKIIEHINKERTLPDSMDDFIKEFKQNR